MVAGGLQIVGQTADKLGRRIRSLTHTGEAIWAIWWLNNTLPDCLNFELFLSLEAKVTVTFFSTLDFAFVPPAVVVLSETPCASEWVVPWTGIFALTHIKLKSYPVNHLMSPIISYLTCKMGLIIHASCSLTVICQKRQYLWKCLVYSRFSAKVVWHWLNHFLQLSTFLDWDLRPDVFA